MRHRPFGLAAVLTFLPFVVGTASCGNVHAVDSASVSASGSGNVGSAGSGGTGGSGGGGASGGGGEAGAPSVASSQVSRAVDVDSANNVAVTGLFVGVLALGDASPITTPSESVQDLFVAKFDADAKPIWTRQFNARNGEGLGVAFDKDGNVVVTGYVYGGFVGDGTVPGSSIDQDLFVGKLDADGQVLWTRVFPAPADQIGFDVVTNDSGDIFVAGTLTGSEVTFDEIGTTLHVEGGVSALLMKLNTNGGVVWAKSFGSSRGVALGIDSAGDVVLTGGLKGTTNFGGAPLTSTWDYDAYLAKFDSSGNHVWSKSFAGPGDGTAYDVAVDSADNIILSAQLVLEVDAGGGPIVDEGHADTFLAKYDPSGNHLWSRGLSGATDNTSVVGKSVDVDSADNIIVGGTLTGKVDFGGGPLESVNVSDIFLAKFNPFGDWLANQRFGGSGSEEEAAAVCMDQTERAIVTGRNAPIDFGGAPSVQNQIPGNSNFFVAWLKP